MRMEIYRFFIEHLWFTGGILRPMRQLESVWPQRTGCPANAC